MNQKGFVAGVMILLVTGVVGLVVLDSLTSTFCAGCTQQTNITELNVDQTAGTWYNNTCTGAKCDTNYALYCNGTELEAGVDYSISDCNFRVENAAYNATDCTLEYTADTGANANSGLLGVIVCLLPVLVALGLMVLAASWAVLK